MRKKNAHHLNDLFISKMKNLLDIIKTLSQDLRVACSFFTGVVDIGPIVSRASDEDFPIIRNVDTIDGGSRSEVT